MWNLDAQSLALLKQADARLQTVFQDVAAGHFMFRILETKRDRKAQEAAHRAGHSNAHFGQSPHNYDPALGLDAVPLPLDWHTPAAFKALAAFVMKCAERRNIQLVWGGTFTHLVDMPHYELLNWRHIAQTEYDPNTLRLRHV